MTKLMEWLSAGVLFIAVWIALITNTIGGEFTRQNPLIIYLIPFIAVGLFGIYAAGTVLYRTLTFNTCEKAAVELQKEIEDARNDLISKGFVFKEAK